MIAGREELRGRTALVTGGARRIGRGIALALAEHGCDVCFTYRSSADEAQATRRDLQSKGVRAFAVRCDLAEAPEIAPAVEESIEALGRLDLLINNAGLYASVDLEAISVAAWDEMFHVNARAPLLVAQACLPKLREASGRIVNIGSLGGVHPWATHGHYCTSKAALHMLSDTMAKAWAPAVSVNCVAPGMIVQGEVDPSLGRFAAKTPMGRNGTVADVVDAVLYFATAPHFITGQRLVVDGGLGL